ncbi:SRPBCC family protein [Nocardiopsis algeriensis]|uniref:SRPBCC family protein n=1 Tax=Nocardiopsis algeriensis TaxID=1478215 RepID=UPI003B42E263
MSDIVETVEVDVPVSVAYAQWTDFEQFPRFMEGVNSITRTGERLLHWNIEIAGQKREFDAEVTEQVPQERIAWRSVDGVSHAGVVTFHHISASRTRITLQLRTVPEGAVEQLGDKLGLVKARAKGDMKRFKEYIEGARTPDGAPGYTPGPTPNTTPDQRLGGFPGPTTPAPGRIPGEPGQNPGRFPGN